MATVELWRKQMSSETCSSRGVITWKERYVSVLKKLEAMDNFDASNLDESTLADRLDLEEKASKIEKTHRVQSRWTPSTTEYINVEVEMEKNTKLGVLKKMNDNAKELRFLSNMKVKYAVGQAIANRLSRRISRVERMMRKQLKVYNSLKRTSSLPLQIDLAEAKDPRSQVYLSISCTPDHEQVSLKFKQDAIDVVHKLRRAHEEMDLCKEEANRVDKSIQVEISLLEEKILLEEEASRLSLGLKAKCAYHLLKLKKQRQDLTLSCSFAKLPTIYVESALLNHSNLVLSDIESDSYVTDD